MFWLEKGNRVSGFFYSTAVDIEDTAKKSKDQSCISTGTENNSCSDKCGGILEKRTDQCTCKEAGNCPSDYQKRKKNERKEIIKDMNYTYIVKCSDGSLYTGWTNNLEKRIKDHNAGRGAKYT